MPYSKVPGLKRDVKVVMLSLQTLIRHSYSAIYLLVVVEWGSEEDLAGTISASLVEDPNSHSASDQKEF